MKAKRFSFVISSALLALFPQFGYGQVRGCSHLMICVYILIFGRRSGCFGWY